jgi:Fe-S-cluster containining protein
MVAKPLMTTVSDDIPACAGCGQCCHLLVELAPLVDDVPEEFVVEHSGVRCMDQHGDGACVALDPVSRLCTIYERRPQVCRDFQRAEALCRRAVLRGYGPYGTAPDAAGIAPAPVA